MQSALVAVQGSGMMSPLAKRPAIVPEPGAVATNMPQQDNMSLTRAVALLDARVSAIIQWTDGAHNSLQDHAQRIDDLKVNRLLLKISTPRT